MELLVINLDDDRERMRDVTRNLRDHRVPFERWRATPGTDLDHERFGLAPVAPGVLVSADFRQWSRNEAACGVSHIRALQHMIRERIPWAVIMEDDGLFVRQVPPRVEALDPPDDADIVLLNARAEMGAIRKKGPLVSYGDVVGGAGTEGYMVSLSGASKMLDILTPLKDPLDFQMYSHFASVQDAHGSGSCWSLPQNPRAKDVRLNAYRISPSLIAHTGHDSSIGNQRHPRARLYCQALLGLIFDDAPQAADPWWRRWWRPGY